MNVTPEILLRAYASGVFPMAESADDDELFWVQPERRGVLPLDGLHVPRRLARTMRQAPFDVRIDHDFRAMVELCAASASDRPLTWISDQIVELYAALHEQGHAHSVECWAEGELAGGLYGVTLNGAFFGESMVTRKRDASKIALVHLVERLNAGGFVLLDTQFMTDHLARFGAVEIPRAEYEDRLADALQTQADFFALDKA